MGAVALPRALNGPGRWFLLAGFLKVLLVAQLHTPLVASFALLGYALPAGPTTLLVTLLAGLVLVYVSKEVVERNWLQKRLTLFLVVCASVLLLVASSVLFGSPRTPALSPAQHAERQRAIAKEVARRASMSRRTAADADRILEQYDQRMAERQQQKPT
ncbi:hypothetical protein WJX81_001426 [Elliptochloris bilobata]|uniref:Uncharacterized protein n=1 Tax=Elliptochloris bilobata TaxID=381761 RepID=A0AAW1QXS3_9CHLO